MRRPKPIDILRTLYIYATLWLGVIAYILLFGPLLLLADYTVDKRRRPRPQTLPSFVPSSPPSFKPLLLG